MLQLLCRSTGFSTVPRGQTQYRDLSLTAMVLAIFPWMRVVCDFEHRRWRGEAARPSPRVDCRTLGEPYSCVAI